MECIQVLLSLNYMQSRITGPFFTIFLCVWVYMRHYLNLAILWSIVVEFSSIGPYHLDWAAEQYKCWISQVITFLLLATLQGLNLMWLFLLLRVGRRYWKTGEKVDDRSDEE
jgi:acyl-CoA-dependent ceramide synthase